MGKSQKKPNKISDNDAESDPNNPFHSEVAAAIMAMMGYAQSQGLGKYSQGIKEPIQAIRRPKGVGLGYVLAEDDDMPVPPPLPHIPLAPAPEPEPAVGPFLPPPNNDIAAEVVCEAEGPPNDDERIDIVPAEAAETWKEFVLSARMLSSQQLSRLQSSYYHQKR